MFAGIGSHKFLRNPACACVSRLLESCLKLDLGNFLPISELLGVGSLCGAMTRCCVIENAGKARQRSESAQFAWFHWAPQEMLGQIECLLGCEEVQKLLKVLGVFGELWKQTRNLSRLEREPSSHLLNAYALTRYADTPTTLRSADRL